MGIADSVYPRRFFAERSVSQASQAWSSRELSRRRPSLETQSLDNYQRESMAGYSPRRCRVYEVVIYFGAQSALFGLSDDVDANNREGFLRRRGGGVFSCSGRVSWGERCGREWATVSLSDMTNR